MNLETQRKIIKGLKLIGWQRKFASIFQSLDPNDKLIVKASRQKGKSTTICQALLYCAINHPGSHSYFISPTNDQCRKQFSDLRDSCATSPLVTKLNESLLEIRFANRSVIFFKSAEAGEHLRGNVVKNGGILCIDEAAFIKDDTIAILLPYVTVHKAPIIMISTPRRTRGTYYDWWIKAIHNDKGYKYIDVNEFDNSFFITDEQIEDYRRIMTPEKFKNEILGLFTDSNEGVFGDYSKVYAEPDDLEPVYIGIDWSTTGEDATIMSGFNSKHQQCFLWSDNAIKDPVERLEKMATILNSYPSIKKIIVEKNSIGAVYSSMLKRLYKHPNQIEEFVTSNSSKQRIVEQLVAKIGKGEITLLNDPEQDYEFSIFTSTTTPKGGTTYMADPKCQNSHDDRVMATCFAVDALNSNQGNYSFGHSSTRKKVSKYR